MRDLSTTTTKLVFTGVVVISLVEWLMQVRKSEANADELITKGGKEWEPERMKRFAIMQLAFYASLLLELWGGDFLGISFGTSEINIAAGAVFVVIGQVLRRLAMKVQDWRWTLRIIIHRAIPAPDMGIYKVTNQPNLWATRLEYIGLPVIHGCLITAAVFYFAATIFQKNQSAAIERAYLGFKKTGPDM